MLLMCLSILFGKHKSALKAHPMPKDAPEEVIHVVLLQGDEEVDRVTIRGDPGLLSSTPLVSLQEIIEEELGVAIEDQILFLGEEELRVVDDAEEPLKYFGATNGDSIFVIVNDDADSGASTMADDGDQALGPSGNGRENLQVTTEGSVQRLLHAIRAYEGMNAAQALTALERRWKETRTIDSNR